ncbi:MAG: bifunctional homocysteine S-methyltransferase/methylenetetrahydrofolate reductase [Tissierellia bacterium]|nr:bifunctional homocysteine S-methyltransferase/methylenetetrahydrofolate reductase [Tissierellia bacterium]
MIMIFDGAMGTYYRNKKENPLPECEMANLFDRDTIAEIHREYIAAGANCIKTNTFSANTSSLSAMPDIIEKIIISGCELALNAAEEKIKVFADIGPIYGDDRDDIYDEYINIIDIFLENGVKNFLFETFSSSDYLPELAEYIKKKSEDSYIITSFAIGPDGYTRSSYNGEHLIKEMADTKVDAVGFNCISGPYHLLEYVKEIKLPEIDLIVMPNAGYPSVVGNRTYYADNSSYFAKTTAEFIDLGFKILGGCCGTTPEHIEKLTASVKNRDTKEIPIHSSKKSYRLETKPSENLFYKKLISGKKVIAVEYDPPASCNIKSYMENVKKLKTMGVDAITVADCPVGRARFDSSLIAYKIKNEVDLDPVVHLTCRDRNLNATKALLLGLNVENILNLIIVTGDPIPTAQRDEIKSVFNFNSALLSKYINELNEELFTNNMVVSTALNVNAPNFDAELRKAVKKEEMGSKVFFTQPVVSEKASENLKKARSVLKSHIMGGIIPIISHKNAVFMNEEISGISVDEDIIEIYDGISKEEASKLAVSTSMHFIDKISDYVDGFYLITPFNRVDIIENIINEMRA